MKGKDLDKFMKNELENYSIELFNKHYDALDISEIDKLSKYMHDVYHPKWKPIIIDDEFTIYSINNIGNIRNNTNGYIMNPGINNDGYLQVSLQLKDKQCQRRVHRLVANAFIPNPDNKPVVNHINGIKTCNWVGNLEWVTPIENTQHAIKNGLFVNRPDIKNTYTESDIHNVCKMLEDTKLSCSYIASQTGVSISMVSAIASGRLWKNVRSQYNIPTSRAKSGDICASSKATSEQIIQACELLTKSNLSYKDIALETGVPYSTVVVLHKKELWPNITSQYDFPKKKHCKSNS